MTAPVKPLADDAARQAAIAIHDRSFLVEAGAGSGKTAVMAGRIAMMLAEGIEPKFIAAVTFTEFAASELLIRNQGIRQRTGSRAHPDRASCGLAHRFCPGISATIFPLRARRLMRLPVRPSTGFASA